MHGEASVVPSSAAFFGISLECRFHCRKNAKGERRKEGRKEPYLYDVCNIFVFLDPLPLVDGGPIITIVTFWTVPSLPSVRKP